MGKLNYIITHFRFIEKTKNILTSARKMREELKKIAGIKLCSDDDVSNYFLI